MKNRKHNLRGEVVCPQGDCKPRHTRDGRKADIFAENYDNRG